MKAKILTQVLLQLQMSPALLIAVLALLRDATVEAQTGECHNQARYACVGRDQFRECVRNRQGQLEAREPSFTCDSLTRKFPNPVCYGAALSREQICGAPPPSCRAEGNFPVPGRCMNFYTCVRNGNGFVQYISECQRGFEFNARYEKCTSTGREDCRNKTMITHLSGDSEENTPNPYLTTASHANIHYSNPTTNKPFTSQFQSFTVRNNKPVETSTFRPVNFITTNNFQEQFPSFTARPVTSQDRDDDIFTGSKSSPDEQIKCTAPFTRIADPQSCFYFYECSAKNTPVKVLCPFKMRYDEVEKDCKPFAQCGTRPMYRPTTPQEQESFLTALKNINGDDDATDTDEDVS